MSEPGDVIEGLARSLAEKCVGPKKGKEIMASAVPVEMSNTSMTRPIRKSVLFSSFLGTALEYYDLFIYGAAAALAFGRLFFPKGNPTTALLASFATLAVAYFARPFGSILFGWMGDKFGRKPMLVLSLMLMGIGTVGIGLLPTYDMVGIYAPILLVLCRVFQGIGLGGEWGGAALMLVEDAPPHQRSLLGSVVQMGTPAGLLLANGVIGFSVHVSGKNFLTWGWRIPFLLSIVLLVVGIFVRRNLAEPEEFARNHERLPRLPLFTVFSQGWRALVGAFLLAGPGNGLFLIVITFALIYVPKIAHIQSASILVMQMCAAALYLITIPAFGYLADRIGGVRTSMIGSAACLVVAVVFFPVVQTGSPVAIFGATAFALVVGHGSLQAPQAALFSSAFDVRVRYTGIALSQAIPTMIVAGLTPMLTSALYAWTGSTAPISAYLVGLAVAGFAGGIWWMLCVQGRTPAGSDL